MVIIPDSIFPEIRRMQRKLIIALLLALAANAAAADAPKKAAKEVDGLTADFVFKFLVGEIAGQRGDMNIAGAALFDLAKSSRDVRLAERAARAAIYGNQPQLAMQATRLWAELAPDSVEANQALTQMLLATGNISELRPYLEKLIVAEDNKAGIFMYLVGMISRSNDKAGALKLMQGLTQPYADLPEAHFALAHAAWGAGQDKLALNELDKADQLNPGWEPAAMLHGQVLLRKSAADTLAYYKQFLDTNPQASEVRLAYARLLVNEKQFELARAQFGRLIEVAPDNAEIQVVVGLLNVQMEDFSAAEANFLKALDLNFKDADQVKLYLGQVAERRQNDDSAQVWYSKVDNDSPQYLDAQLRSANIQVKHGQLEQARKRIHDLELTNEQRVVAIQTEAGWLDQAKRQQEAFDLLKNAVETLPNSPDLIYDYAMMADKVGNFELMEHELRKLILLKPDMGHAYNALGYSLADRNERLDEAQKLIEKALVLSPNDYFILDSMGWVKYRRGQLAQALDYLKRAYAAQPDPEVAAHLGEVLWQQGKHEEAVKTWEEALQAHPENETLQKTSKKFQQ
jgi:tetratricopeptide (TPR) repeat protein